MSLALGVYVTELEEKPVHELQRYYRFRKLQPISQVKATETLVGRLTQFVQLYSSRGPKQSEDIIKFMPYEQIRQMYANSIKAPEPISREQVKRLMEGIKAKHGR